MEDKKYNIDDELIFRFLLKETDAEEDAAVLSWLAHAPKNKLYIDKQKKLIDIVELSKISPDAEFEKFKSKYIVQKPQTKKLFMSSVQFRILAAATVILLIGLTLFFTLTNKNRTQQILISSGKEIKELKLADGSDITLNSNSSIEYPQKFSSKERRVVLKGEAFFSVKHNPAQPFIVDAGDINVTVLGTSFFVRAVEHEYEQVFVQEGTVRCFQKSTSKEIILHKGEQFSFKSIDSEVSVPVEEDLNSFAWKTNKLVFTNARFSDIVFMLNQTYGSNIQISDNLKNCRITVSFLNVSTDGALKILENILDIKIDKSSGIIRISGRGC